MSRSLFLQFPRTSVFAVLALSPAGETARAQEQRQGEKTETDSGVRASTAPALPAIVPDVIYGHKAGMALTYDIVKPARSNGAAVLFMVSGGWVSQWIDPAPLIAGAVAARDRNAFGMLLDKGYTLYLVRHGSSPYFKVPDAVGDVRRAVRHIRLHAASQGIDADRLGVFGGSAGGHLSLMLGTTADPGNPASADPVEKVSDRVAAVCAYFPPTDLAGYIGDKRFPALHFPAEQSDAVSPLKHVSADDAPSLLVHGGKDTLVLPSHSENILEAFKKAGVATDLLAFPEAGHAFVGEDEKKASLAVTAWFDRHLAASPDKIGTAASAPSPEAPVVGAMTKLEGIWQSHATLPDGSRRPGRLTVRREEGGWSAVAAGEHGARKADTFTWENGRLRLEIRMEREGRAGLIRVEAGETAPGTLTGTWTLNDEAGATLATGRWEAARQTAAGGG